MNKHILFVIDHQLNPGKYTIEQLEENYRAAYAAYADGPDAAYAANAAYVYTANAPYWLKRYFERTGENKQDYIDAINKGK